MDYKIVIDAGHGGSDPGASGNGITEKDLTLEISKLMYQEFLDYGVPVTLVRDSDETVDPTERVKRILNAYGNNEKVIVISNHINAGGGDGAEVIYALRNDDKLANLILNNLELEGQNPRKVYQRRLPSDTSKDYYYIHRETGITEPVIIEYGFLDSPGDDVNQLKQDYANYASATVKAVLQYIGESSTDSYIVKAGDSLYSIAQKFNTTVSVIKDINNLTSDSLYIGQILILPKENEQTGSYIVKSGDTLYSIALKFNTTTTKLKSLNNLTSDVLTVGQKLIVPNEIQEDLNTYVVQKGDSLYSIATKYNITVDEIKKLNNLTSNNLSIGQILIISGEIKPEEDKDEDILEETYIVKSGDTLYSIAKLYNISVDELKELNNLTSNILSLGQKLIVKKNVVEPSIPETDTYVVQKGDSLYSIASKFNTTVSELTSLNNLNTSLLSIGQILKIPNNSDEDNNIYIVQKGDSLYSIARKFNTTVSNIKTKNNLTNEILSIGQKLII